jgi:hypothetical protein
MFFHQVRDHRSFRAVWARHPPASE